MTITTKIFGEITIEDDKIIHFEKGIVGFSDLTDFTLIFDSDDKEDAPIRWLQSIQEPGFAMPVMDPLLVKPDYTPEIADELLVGLGDLTPDNMLVVTTVTVPSDIKKLTTNLMAPIIVNTENLKACQVIVDGDDYPVKFPIYPVLQAARKKAGV